MADEIVFFTNPQSRGAMTHWMLEEIGCPYRLEVVAYGPPMKSAEFLAVNPMGKVPALVTDSGTSGSDGLTNDGTLHVTAEPGTTVPTGTVLCEIKD